MNIEYVCYEYFCSEKLSFCWRRKCKILPKTFCLLKYFGLRGHLTLGYFANDSGARQHYFLGVRVGQGSVKNFLGWGRPVHIFVRGRVVLVSQI